MWFNFALQFCQLLVISMAYCSVATPLLNIPKALDFKNMTVLTRYKINLSIPPTLKRIAMAIAKIGTVEIANKPHIVKMTFCRFSGMTHMRISRHKDILTLHIIRHILGCILYLMRPTFLYIMYSEANWAHKPTQSSHFVWNFRIQASGRHKNQRPSWFR